jgi:hypothetical protein
MEAVATLRCSDGSVITKEALQLAKLRYNDESVTTTLRYNDGSIAAAQRCSNGCYISKKKNNNKLMTPGRFKSFQPPPLRARKREKESEKEKEKALKPVLVSLFLALRLSSDPSVVGWQRFNNTSSSGKLPPIAPSNSTNNTTNKKKFKNSTPKEICYFQH